MFASTVIVVVEYWPSHSGINSKKSVTRVVNEVTRLVV